MQTFGGSRAVRLDDKLLAEPTTLADVKYIMTSRPVRIDLWDQEESGIKMRGVRVRTSTGTLIEGRNGHFAIGDIPLSRPDNRSCTRFLHDAIAQIGARKAGLTLTQLADNCYGALDTPSPSIPERILAEGHQLAITNLSSHLRLPLQGTFLRLTTTHAERLGIWGALGACDERRGFAAFTNGTFYFISCHPKHTTIDRAWISAGIRAPRFEPASSWWDENLSPLESMKGECAYKIHCKLMVACQAQVAEAQRPC